MYAGDIRLGATIDLKFTTRKFSTGAPFTLAGSPAVVAYVGNGTTEITAGITLTVDFDSVTGLNNVRVVASGGNGFATATDVYLSISAGTVDGVSVVGEVIGAFSIENRSALMPTTAGRTATVNSGGDIDANVTKLLGTAWLTPGTAGTPDVNVKLWNALTTVALPLAPTVAGRTLDVTTTGEAGIDWANIGAPTTTVNLSGTTIATTQVVAAVSGAVGSVTGAVGSVTGNVGGNVVGSIGLVAANGITAASFAANALDAVWSTATRTLTSFGTLVADVATAVWGAGTRTLTSFGTLVADTATAVWGAATRILTAGTNIVLAKGTGVTGFNDLSAAQVNAEADTALADYDGPTNAELATALAAADDATLAAIAALVIPTANQNAAAVLDLTDGVETSLTLRQALRLIVAAEAGKLSGAATTTITIRNVGDTKDRIVATVDADGNRSAITRDVT